MLIPVNSPLDERFKFPLFLADIIIISDSSALSSFFVRFLNTAK